MDPSDPMGFNGKSIDVEFCVNLKDVIFGDDVQTQTISYQRNVKCSDCNGTREAGGDQGSICYSCKGAGVRLDPLF